MSDSGGRASARSGIEAADAVSLSFDGALRSIRRAWKQQTAPRIEDEIVDAAGGRSISRFVVPVIAPILIVPAILLVQEPGNSVAALTLGAGAVALLYSILGNALERKAVHPFWMALANAAVYSAIISGLMWTFITFEHPREHIHWVIFFLYFLMIGGTGLSDDPRQPLTAGCLAIVGYVCVILVLHAAVAAGTSPMAQRLAPEFEWVANSAKIFLLLGAMVLATASAQRGRELRRSSLRDGLTGLLNRHAFDRCLEHLANRSKRRGEALSVAMVDIDHFKGLNDSYGHATGDDVLRWVGSELQRSFRATDLVARYGGEEFVVAFPDADHERFGERLERVRRTIAARELRARGDARSVRTTVSIGAARYPADGESVHDVLARADERLYLAKNQGRDRVVLSAPSPDPSLHRASGAARGAPAKSSAASVRSDIEGGASRE